MNIFRQFITIAGLTALETIRKPITYLIFITSMTLVMLFPMIITHTLGDAFVIVCDSALALQFVCGLLLGSYAASSSLTRELRAGTAGSVLSKPVGRGVFFLAKYAGIAVVMLAYSAGLCMATMISGLAAWHSYHVNWYAPPFLIAALVIAQVVAGMINYTRRRPFCSNAFILTLVCTFVAFAGAGWIDPAGRWTSFGAMYNWSLVSVSLLVAMGVLVLSALALALAVRLENVAVLSACTVVFFLGMMSDYLFGRGADASWIQRLFYIVLPNWQNFWVVDAIRLETEVPGFYLVRAAAYAATYILSMLFFGWFAFNRTEVT